MLFKREEKISDAIGSVDRPRPLYKPVANASVKTWQAVQLHGKSIISG